MLLGLLSYFTATDTFFLHGTELQLHVVVELFTHGRLKGTRSVLQETTDQLTTSTYVRPFGGAVI